MGRNPEMKAETKTEGRKRHRGGRKKAEREPEAEDQMCSAGAGEEERKESHTFEVCLSHFLSSAKNR